MKNGHVHKFGGSCFTSAQGYQDVGDLITGKSDIIIVSAVYGITNRLLKLLTTAAQKKSYTREFETIHRTHQEIIGSLFDKKTGKSLMASIEEDMGSIKTILRSVSLLGSYSDEMYDLVLGFGEQWSAKILTTLLNKKYKTQYVDAREVLFIDKDNQGVHILWRKSENSFSTFCKKNPGSVYVVTGFIASTRERVPTTLGRNGSDFSASIFARLSHAEDVTFWKDVDGIMSADPRRVPSAFVLDELTYEELLELAYFGAGVIHPKAIAPAVEKEIPIRIRNSTNPSHPGTTVFKKASSQYSIKGLTHIDAIALVTIEGSGMVGVPGFAARIFEILHSINISVILISQASSEHSICFAIPAQSSKGAIDFLKKQLRYELREKVVRRILAETTCSILSVVGENMVGTCGVAATICKALAKASVNIKAIAQGSSERNVSLVIDSTQVTKALRAVHSAFYLSNKTLSIGLIGPGLIGKTLLQQLQQAEKRLEEQANLSLRVRGITNSKKMLCSERKIDLARWEKRLADKGVPADHGTFIDNMISEEYPHTVIVDCTSSETISGQYSDYLKKGLHVITPNKRASSAPLKKYHALQETILRSPCQYFYETTVCAGLPVITTLQDLLATGDEVLEIEGIFSGTLAYIFYHFQKDAKFSHIVKNAQKMGYTEPDPRDDLSGMDIARKVVILAREIGLSTELGDVKVQSLVPKDLEKVSTAQFLAKLSSYDSTMKKGLEKALAQGNTLRYVGSIKSSGKVSVELKAYPQDHAFSNLKETDNIVSFKTRRYFDQPLIVRGPGAGAEVTAAGIFADILRLARSLD